MQRKLDQWTTALSAVLIVGALLACKKKTDTAAAPAPSQQAAVATAAAPPASVSPPAVPTASAPPDAKLGDVKRYPSQEKAETGAVKILENDVKVFNEADDKTADVATLGKDLFVFRLASIPDWELVEFPSGVGKVSPGWVPAKFINKSVEAKVERGAVVGQAKQATVRTATTAKPTASASASASASAKAPSPVSAEKAAADKKAADAKAAVDKEAADAAAAAEKAAADKKARAEKRAAARKAKADAAAKAAAGQ